MGWWSYDILGGDSPMDGVGMLEQTVRWPTTAGGITHADPARVLKALRAPGVMAKVKAMLISKAAREDNIRDGTLLGAFSVLVKAGVELDDDLKALARRCAMEDEFGAEEPRRRTILANFVAMLDYKSPKDRVRKYTVTVTRTIKQTASIPVVARSEREAREKAAKDVERSLAYCDEGPVAYKFTVTDQ